LRKTEPTLALVSRWSRGTAASGAKSSAIPRFVFVLTNCRVAATAS
jgi:hypothetical protein